MKIDLPVALEHNKSKYCLFVEYRPVFDKDDVVGYTWIITYVGLNGILIQHKHYDLLLAVDEVKNLIKLNNYKELRK